MTPGEALVSYLQHFAVIVERYPGDDDVPSEVDMAVMEDHVGMAILSFTEAIAQQTGARWEDCSEVATFLVTSIRDGFFQSPEE
jgi:hypothetical protein